MSTQATTSGSNQLLPGAKIKRFLSYGLVAIASMVIGLVIGFKVLPRMSVEAGATAPPVRPQHPDLSAQESRPLQAETARYTGLAEFYSPHTSPSLAANPELRVAQRYTTAVDNETGEPATFDVETLPARYFDEWRIEAQAPDVRSVINPIKGNVSGQPATFDVGTLPVRYFDEWAIEAQAPDVRSVINPIKGNVSGQPATFDVETLPARYFDEWAIETQAPDIRSVINPIKGNVSGQPATFDVEALHTQYFNEWRIEANSVGTGLTHAHPVILADNSELSLASRYSDYIQWRRIHHPGR